MPKPKSKAKPVPDERPREAVIILDEGFCAPLTEHTQMRATLIEIEGVPRVSLRQWYKTRNDPEWKPGRQGITLPLDLFPKFTTKLSTMVADYKESTVEEDE